VTRQLHVLRAWASLTQWWPTTAQYLAAVSSMFLGWHMYGLMGCLHLLLVVAPVLNSQCKAWSKSLDLQQLL
jgi:hypothetical protein